MDPLDEITAWIDDRLAGTGSRRRGPVREVRNWVRALVLTVDTDRGRCWVKVVPDLFSHEVAVTELLADVDPGFVPPVVAADHVLGRIITEHVDGPALDSIDDVPTWRAALSRLAEIQRVLAADPLVLRVAGVAASPLDELAAFLPELLADDLALLVGAPGGLSVAEAASIRGRLPELVDVCHALAAIGIPDSLDHGDLAPDEVIVGAMGPVFLDWSDGSITNPFLSGAALLAHGEFAPRDADLEAAYLGPWLASGVVSEAAGRAALNLARVVEPFHRAQIAHRVLAALPREPDIERTVPEALRAILPG
jgi:hypothetical protein